mgnify:CR=1 FL=1
MQEKIREIISICEYQGVTAEMINEKRNIFADNVKDILLSDDITNKNIHEKIKNLFSTKDNCSEQNHVGVNVLEQLEYVIEFLNNLDSYRDILNDPKSKKRLVNTIRDCIGKKIYTKEKVKGIFYSGMRGIAHSQLDANLELVALNTLGQPLTIQYMLELFHKVNKISDKKNEWYNFIVKLPENKILINNEESAANLIKYFLVWDMNEGFNDVVLKKTIDNTKKVFNWNIVSAKIVNKILEKYPDLKDNHFLLLREVLKERTESNENIFMVSHSKNFHAFLEDITKIQNLPKFIKQNCEDLLIDSLDKDKEIIKNAIKDDRNHNVIKKNRI